LPKSHAAFTGNAGTFVRSLAMNRPTRALAPSATLATLAALATVLLAACGGPSTLPPLADTGPQPTLPPPDKSLVPTVQIADAVGWPAGAAPQPAASLGLSAFATGLAHPRWLHVLPNGDVLVAETAAPPKPEGGGGGIKAKLMEAAMKKAGSAVPSANRITLLRDADGDGRAEVRAPFIENLRSPFGMALVGEELYVANADGVVRFAYSPGTTRITSSPQTVTELPAGRNHHWTKNLLASRDGRKLYATVGSNSNVAEHGLAEEEGRAAVWEIDLTTGRKRLFASGLRNPNGLAWEPQTGALWTVVNERDELGNDLVPDYLTSVTDGGFYGWPWSYFGRHVDDRVQPPRPDMVAKAKVPDYALGAHVAPLGLAWSQGWPAPYASGMFIGEHGSWNRKPLSGYKVVFVPFANGRPAGKPLDVLTGFVNAKGQAQGRPVGVAIDARGGLLVADDVGNTVWRVAPR
jgi:glucose/arabinose dehydrogenase